MGGMRTGRARVSEIREVRLDPPTIRATLRGRRVVVTGAGGSIGGEICRQVAAVGSALLVLLDRDEGGLFEIEAELAEAHPDSTSRRRGWRGWWGRARSTRRGTWGGWPSATR